MTDLLASPPSGSPISKADFEPAASEITALLGRGTAYQGKLSFLGRARLDGQFEGEVRSEGTLIIGPTAEVEGTLEVGTLIVLGGVVRARVSAEDLVEIHAGAHLQGDVETAQIFIEKGARFEGDCRMKSGEPAPVESFQPERALEVIATRGDEAQAEEE